jgi:MerR family transcriptional regulator/heat shock protein HspR
VGGMDDSRSGRNKPLYMISVAAELCGMHPQTLRVYEQKGLVNPGRSRGNTRLYSQADIDRLKLIGRLTDEGINLAGVIRIIDMQERAHEREEEIDALRERVRMLEDEVAELRTRERILSLVPYDEANPARVYRGYLGGSTDLKN